MPTVDVVVDTNISRSTRARQLESMFDVPASEQQHREWHANLLYDDKSWNVGLIVGPSGAGKSLIARELYGADKVDRVFQWDGESVIDDFPSSKSIKEISQMCSAVGFNTIPAWLRPFRVLSNGEQFRATLARQLLQDDSITVVDEFTSVVDRQVAKIASHAVQKTVRRANRQFVAVTCHEDIIDWLQPDWMYRPDENVFSWRSVQPRPQLNITISALSRSAWKLFAPFHYMSAHLHIAAQCFGLWVGDTLTSIACILHKPHPKNRKIKGCSRLVTLPDWQGLGLAFILTDAVGAAYKALGFVYHNYPAHPVFIHSYDRSKQWELRQKPGSMMGAGLDANGQRTGGVTMKHHRHTRPCAVFRYVGPSMDKQDAQRLIDGLKALKAAA